MRIVIATSDRVALQFATDLSRDRDICVIHDGGDGFADFRRLDVEVLEGLGSDPEALRQAAAHQADYFISWTRSDEINILSCLTVRHLAQDREKKPHTICFVEQGAYLRTFGKSAEGSSDTQLGIDTMVWPAWRLADKIEKILAVPGATDVGQFAKGQIGLLEYRLRGVQPLVGRPLMEIKGLPQGVLIAAVTRGEEWFVPRGQSVLAQGDRVLFMGRSQAMQELAAWFSEHLPEASSGEVVIVGGGSVGLRLAQSMERNRKAHLKLIEKQPERCADIAGALKRTLVLNGDGCDLDLFEEERVRYARALVAVTDSDEKNLLVSLLGRQLGIPKVVTRVSSAANRRVFERVGVDVPLSTRGAATEAVLNLIRHEEVDLLATIGEGQGEVLELTLPDTFTERPLKEVVLPPDAIVAAVLRSGEAIVPGGTTKLLPGDHCLVILKAERLDEVRKILLK